MRLSLFVSRRPRKRGDTLEGDSKMQPKNTTTELELLNDSVLPEAVTLHADRPGFFSLLLRPVATAPRQSSCPVGLLPQAWAAFDPDIGSYMSQATFFRPNRRRVNLWHLPLCWTWIPTARPDGCGRLAVSGDALVRIAADGAGTAPARISRKPETRPSPDAVPGPAIGGPRPLTPRRTPDHVVYPYLLSDLRIERVNTAGCADVTGIAKAHGFLYVLAIMNWRLSNTQDTAFCVEVLKEAIERYDCPEIFNTDPGSQFTCAAWTVVLKHHDIRISMDGKGQWMYNIFIERLWRSLKYECIYPNAFRDFRGARNHMDRWNDDYNARRRHSALGALTPGDVYAGIESVPSAA